MWTTLALAALSFTPAQQAGPLQLTNVRLTLGDLGPARPNSRYLPGDTVYVRYDIEGLTIDPDGSTKYTISLEISDAAGKPVFKQEPRELTDLFPLRGAKVPAGAFVRIGFDQDPGMYTCKVTVADLKSKASNSLTTKFEVLKKDFGLVDIVTTYDIRREIAAPTTGTVGQHVFVWTTAVGFQRDPKSKQPNVELEFTVLDEKGAPTLGQPVKRIQDAGVEPEQGAFYAFFPLYMSRPGKYTVRITATDKVANKKSVTELPITVLPQN
jgi:hypothetical protein